MRYDTRTRLQVTWHSKEMTRMSPNQQKIALPPGPKPLPIVGNALAFQRDPFGYLQDLQRIYGRMTTTYIGRMPIILFFQPKHVRYFLTENPHNFTNQEIATVLGMREFLGDGLLTIDGDAHRHQRRLVQPAFHKKRVEGYAQIMTQLTQEMLETWHTGDQFDLLQAMQKLTLHIVAKCLFHVDRTSGVDEMGNAFAETVSNPGSLDSVLGLRIDLPFTSYGRRMAAKRKVDAFIYRLIDQRREEGRDVGDVLSMLLSVQNEEDQRSTLSDTQIHDHMMTFVMAGHETTANALAWTFYLLSKHPEKREKLLSELQRVLAGRVPTVEDIPNLPYTKWVLSEVMRLYPPGWMQGRHAIEAFDLDGYHFPAGTMVAFFQWLMHRHPDLWDSPDEFRPERWDPEHGPKVTQWSYFPFGGGPRICIGMQFAQLEAVLLLATILQHYYPRLLPGYRLTPQPVLSVLRPPNGLQMILEPCAGYI